MNSGSSSLKFKVVEFDESADAAGSRKPNIRYEGSVKDLGHAARLLLHRPGVPILQDKGAVATHAEAVRWMMHILEESSRQEGRALGIDAVGHRVVHGGEQFHEPVRIDDEVFAAIDRLTELAPLHNPGCIAGIKGARAVMGTRIPMVAVFDTGFHHSIPPQAATYAIDLDLAHKHGIRRYGFHGIAHASLAGICAAAVNRPLASLRLITLHLGNGCSATAIDQGRSVDTSMGLTPLEGLVMGTRSGDVDPAVVGHLVRQEGLTVDEVERFLNERSGLLGLSGLSNDMREVLIAAEGRPNSRAMLAVDVFCYRVRKYIGAYLAVLGGADAIVFGGGIGERSAVIRARICNGMDWCGLRLDSMRNEGAVGLEPGEAAKISEDGAKLACYVAGVDEEAEIARATRDCVLTGS
ncbi:MAG TPA: acetate/propionate family kinase, partial [Nitrospiraceae bacterium]|nr:acetate/propionate family kinase [Nitrospiraceae bacterium]